MRTALAALALTAASGCARVVASVEQTRIERREERVVPAAFAGSGAMAVADRVVVHTPDGPVARSAVTIVTMGDGVVRIAGKEGPLAEPVARVARLDLTHDEVAPTERAGASIAPFTPFIVLLGGALLVLGLAVSQ